MALGITTSLIGVYSPRTVQIVVTGLTVGVDYTVTGSWAGGSWPVRAGSGVAESTQVVLSDLATPINVPVTYTVTHDAATTVSDAITVPYGYDAVLQTLAGDASVAVDALDNGAPQELTLRQSTFLIPGRRRPVMRYDIAGGESGQLSFDTEGENTRTLKALLQTGAPLLLRTSGGVGDLEAVSYLSVRRVSSTLLIGTLRRWQLDYQLLDDPEPDTLAGLPTWDDLDASYSGLTWDDFDAEWAGSTWDAFDAHDWATRAAT